MNPEAQLQKLIEGCIQGDRRSQQKIYELHYGKMLAVCRRYAKDHDEANDLLQDGFIKVFTKLEKYNNAGSFEGWIRRIIVNNAIDQFRKKKHDFLLTDSEHLIADEERFDIEDEGFYNIQAQDIVDAMQQLSPAYRTVFNLYVMENYPHKEIAEMLDISVGTSKSNLAKAKQNLRKILETKFIKNYE